MTQAVKSLKSSDLQVEYDVHDFIGASALIGNQGQGIILVSGISLNWSYDKCPRFTELTIGAPLVTYRYKVNLTRSVGSKILDQREFKYGPGEVDRFLVDLNYPQDGVYTTWLSFTYKTINEQASHIYATERVKHDVCEKE